MGGFTEEDARRAVEDVRRGDSLRKASMRWNIPRTTLARRVDGAKPRREASVESQRLTPAQERAVAGWVWVEAQLGRAPTRGRIREVAQQILVSTGDLRPLGKNWINSFMARNPTVKESKQSKSTKEVPDEAANEFVDEPMFVLMEEDGEDSESPTASSDTTKPAG